MRAAFLPDRGVVKVSGEDAPGFLNGLVTTDVTQLRPGLGRFGALLTPQGKIIVDFLITQASDGHGGGFLLDCPRALAQALADKLAFYKLRAKVTVENLSDSLGVIAAWDGDPAGQPDPAFADPRTEMLGFRILAPEGLARNVADQIGAELVDAAAYEAHPAADWISLMATRSRMRRIWIACTGSTSTRVAMSGRKLSRGCSIGAPRAPAP